MAEHLIVVQAVEGSSPFIHPPDEESIVRQERAFCLGCRASD